MSTESLSSNEKVAYAEKVLKQYKSNAYLADLDIQPHLQTDGSISNLEAFIEIKNKTKNPMSCNTPVEKFAAIAPRAVASILEGIDNMNASFAEKKNLFDIYIEGPKEAEEVSEEALIPFADAYDDSYM